MTGRGARAAAATALTVVALLAPAVAWADDAPVVSPHRAAGVAGTVENSLAAFVAAARNGETDIEGDVFVTKDGGLVLSHDSPLSTSRCDGPHDGVPLRSLTLPQVAEMTCEGEPVAVLDDVLDGVREYPTARVRLEIKHPSGDSATLHTQDAVLLARAIATAGMTDRSILQDFAWATTTPAVLAAVPGQQVSALSGEIRVALVRSARAKGAYDFSYRETAATGFWNRVIAAHGLRSVVWTANDPTRARALRAEATGTIITDVPEELRAVLSDPESGCTPVSYTRTGPMRGTTLAAGARSYRRIPLRSPDGRILEAATVRITARTASGTATLKVAPQGTPATTAWEQTLPVTTTPRTTVVQVALGDDGGVRIRNVATRSVSLEVTVVGGTVLDCP